MRLNTYLHEISTRYQLLEDRLRGLDFLSEVSAEQAGLDPQRAWRSSPTGRRSLQAVLKGLDIRPEDTILDVGCGKGAAMRTMLEFPFATVAGLELSELLAQGARRNFSKLQARRAQVHTADAVTFSGYAAFSHVYLYNPFPVDVMVPFLHALAQSLKQHPRHLTLIYKNPKCEAEVLATGAFRPAGRWPDEWGHGYAVYLGLHPGA